MAEDIKDTIEFNSETETIPGTVFNPRQVRLLKRAVIGMGVLLVGGFVLVMVAIVYQASQLGKSTTPPVSGQADAALAVQLSLALKAGQTVLRMALDGNRLAIHVRGADGDEIQVIDLTTGKVVSRLPIIPE